jgi:hypothetical protein
MAWLLVAEKAKVGLPMAARAGLLTTAMKEFGTEM